MPTGSDLVVSPVEQLDLAPGEVAEYAVRFEIVGSDAHTSTGGVFIEVESMEPERASLIFDLACLGQRSLHHVGSPSYPLSDRPAASVPLSGEIPTEGDCDLTIEAPADERAVVQLEWYATLVLEPARRRPPELSIEIEHLGTTTPPRDMDTGTGDVTEGSTGTQGDATATDTGDGSAATTTGGTASTD